MRNQEGLSWVERNQGTDVRQMFFTVKRGVGRVVHQRKSVGIDKSIDKGIYNEPYSV